MSSPSPKKKPPGLPPKGARTLKPLFRTFNDRIYSKFWGPGQCLAMSCNWAQVTLQKGGCWSADDLDQDKIDLATVALKINFGKIHQGRVFDAFDLALRRSYDMTPADIDKIAAHIANLSGVNVFILSKPEKDGGAHAMGFHEANTVCEFFDPNGGLYRGGAEKIVQYAQWHLKNYYSDYTGKACFREVALWYS